MRLDDEVTFATGNITGQQLCPTKLFSRQTLPRSKKQGRGRLDNGKERQWIQE